jgi:hypothetical protein
MRVRHASDTVHRRWEGQQHRGGVVELGSAVNSGNDLAIARSVLGWRVSELISALSQTHIHNCDLTGGERPAECRSIPAGAYLIEKAKPIAW